MKTSFVDEAEIVVESGSGGGGSVHFHRARFLPKGGPDGGDGGRGGDIIIAARENQADLSFYATRTFFKAPHGAPGGANRQHGKDGEALILTVPIGTQVFEKETEELFCDLITPDARFVAAKGGKGGKGNVHYKNSVRQAPRIAQKGRPGKRVSLRLVYKMVTDVGLIGPPNAGKSSLLALITSAKPTIAAYPCTTRLPQLGVHFTAHADSLTFVEIPAPTGSQGDRFLKHVERARVLVLLLDLSVTRDPEDLSASLREVRSRLKTYPGLLLKTTFVALNKRDRVEDAWVEASIAHIEKETGLRTFAISAQSGEGITPLLNSVATSCKLEMD
jgi:GTP-binding protein